MIKIKFLTVIIRWKAALKLILRHLIKVMNKQYNSTNIKKQIIKIIKHHQIISI